MCSLPMFVCLNSSEPIHIRAVVLRNIRKTTARIYSIVRSWTTPHPALLPYISHSLYLCPKFWLIFLQYHPLYVVSCLRIDGMCDITVFTVRRFSAGHRNKKTLFAFSAPFAFSYFSSAPFTCIVYKCGLLRTMCSSFSTRHSQKHTFSAFRCYATSFAHKMAFPQPE